ncbi:hypothetical protein MBLNU459_g2961t1 [Dothideomycetes sp. NU459]
MSVSSTSFMSRKRIGITNAQRAALRRHAHTNPRLRQAQLAAWFESEFGHKVSQGTVSESLSSKFLDLDNEITNPAHLDRQKSRSEAWPELESALFQWYCWHVNVQTNRPVTDALLRVKAEHFWSLLEPYRGINVPAFSNGWLDRFKKRHSIGSRYRVTAERYSGHDGITVSDYDPPGDRDVIDPRIQEGGAYHAAPGAASEVSLDSNSRSANESGHVGHVRPDISSCADEPLRDGGREEEQGSRIDTAIQDETLPDFPGLLGDSRGGAMAPRAMAATAAAHHSGPDIAKVTTTEALRYLQTLELYELQQDDGEHDFLEALYKYRTVILKRHYARG